MTTRVKGLKISQVPELTELTGEEMIPYQYKCTNGKISTSTLAEYVAENYGDGSGSGNGGASSADVEQLKRDVNTLDSRVDTLDTNVGTLNTNVGTLTTKVNNNTAAIEELNEALSNAGGGSSAPSLQKVTYTALKAKVDAGTLVPGTKYAITDYSCIYIQPETNIEMEVAAPDFKYIVCTAISNKELSYDVDIVRSDDKEVKIISAKYSINPELCSWTKGMTSKQPKGVIFSLEDSNRNKLSYDFKHIKFRRWAVKDITANTTVDTGSNTNTSPFRCCVADTTRKIGDERYFIGAGDPTELNYVKSIFNGTWRLGGQSTPAHGYNTMTYNSGAGVAINTYHDDYIKQVLKPYQDTTYANDKYIAWQTDMFAAEGLSAKGSVSSSATWMGGMTNVNVDANDFMDRYTFDFEGQEVSDYVFTDAKGNKQSVVNNNVMPVCNEPSLYELILPNLVFALSKSCFELDDTHVSTKIVDNKFAYTTKKSTILMRNYYHDYAGKWCQVANNDFGESFKYNLVITLGMLTYAYFNNFRNNYMNGIFSYVNIGNKSWGNVMIGAFTQINFDESNCNLMFGNISLIKTAGDTKFKASPDGENWYNVYSDHWFSCNIMSPIQYTHIGPHVNANTFTAVFNKGVNIGSAITLNVFGPLKWGVNIGYTAFQGIYVRSMQQTTVPASCAIPNIIANAKGINKINSSNKATVPTLVCVDVELARASLLNLANDIADMTGYPENHNRCKLYQNNSGVFELVSGILSAQGEAASVSLMSEDGETESVRKMYDIIYPSVDDSAPELNIEY